MYYYFYILFVLVVVGALTLGDNSIVIENHWHAMAVIFDDNVISAATIVEY